MRIGIMTLTVPFSHLLHALLFGGKLQSYMESNVDKTSTDLLREAQLSLQVGK